MGMAAAVAAVSAGYTGVANAGSYDLRLSENGLGDLALVPYYTVRESMISGIIITNTSDYTQVVKLRLRRGTDSMDALDFNLIMSPYDQWTGFISDDEDGTISFRTTDNTCTAPYEGYENGIFEMPGLYREGADEGYIEVIAMGRADDDEAISVYAKHQSNGEPLDCYRVEQNFFANNFFGKGTGIPGNGVVDYETTRQDCDIDDEDYGEIDEDLGCTSTDEHIASDYDPAGNVLKVSFFIRNDDTGTEFGNAATHISYFEASPTMTDQQYGIFSGDLWGFDFPDLDGSAPPYGKRGKFLDLRNGSVIGGGAVINSWSANPNTNLGTDWVVTAPGQYLMMELIEYLNEILLGQGECNQGDYENQNIPFDDDDDWAGTCDFRDIPLEARFRVWDREEQGIVSEPGKLVVSPSLPGRPDKTLLPNEVNVVEWGTQSVLKAEDPITVGTPDDALFGWANLTVTSQDDGDQAICYWGVPPGDPTELSNVSKWQECYSTSTPAALIGFVAWQRAFPDSPEASYGRIVEHAYTIDRTGVAEEPCMNPQVGNAVFPCPERDFE
jgi:hypothetical protein